MTRMNNRPRSGSQLPLIGPVEEKGVAGGPPGLSVPGVLQWGPKGAPAVLLLHGPFQEPATWSPVAEGLSREGFRVIAPPLWTPPPEPGGYTIRHAVAAVLDMMDGLGVTRFDVAGYFSGGALAWILAAFHPDRVRSVTSFCHEHPAACEECLRSEGVTLSQLRAAGLPMGAAQEEEAAGMLENGGEGLELELKDQGVPRRHMERSLALMQQPGALAAVLSWGMVLILDEAVSAPAVQSPALLVWDTWPKVLTQAQWTARHVHAPFVPARVPEAGPAGLERAPHALLEVLTPWLRTDWTASRAPAPAGGTSGGRHSDAWSRP